MTNINKKILIPDRIYLKKGYGGLHYFELRSNGAKAHLYLHGGQVLHYQPAGQQPVLWQSKKSMFESGKPIRGGIPICWPWFGAHPDDPNQPSHGFVRLTEWEPISTSATEKATIVTLQFPVSHCPKGISLHLRVELNDRLLVSLITTNNAGTDFKFSEALHSYFSIEDIHKVNISGLEGLHYINQLALADVLQKQTGPISFSSETDRIYTNTKHDCTIIDPALNRSIYISKRNSLSTVVWNPWIDKSIRMKDFEDREFLKMVCVETANCNPNPIILSPGENHILRLEIYVKNNNQNML